MSYVNLISHSTHLYMPCRLLKTHMPHVVLEMSRLTNQVTMLIRPQQVVPMLEFYDILLFSNIPLKCMAHMQS